MSFIEVSGPGSGVSTILGDFGPQAFHSPEKLALIWESGSCTYGSCVTVPSALPEPCARWACNRGIAWRP